MSMEWFVENTGAGGVYSITFVLFSLDSSLFFNRTDPPLHAYVGPERRRRRALLVKHRAIHKLNMPSPQTLRPLRLLPAHPRTPCVLSSPLSLSL